MAEFDTKMFAPLMKQVTPNEATNQLLDTMAKAQTVRGNELGIDFAKFDLAMKNINAVSSMIGSFLGDPDVDKAGPDGTSAMRQKIIDGTTRLVKDNIYSAQHVTEALKTMPTDPTRMRQWLMNNHSLLQTAAERGQSFFGSPQGVSDQAGTRIIQAPGYPNLPAAERGYVPDQLPPNTATRQADPNKPGYGQGQYLGPSGHAGLQQPGQGIGVMPRLGGASGQRAPAAASPAVPVRELAPGAAEAAQRAGQASGEMLAAERSRAANYRREIYPLEQAIPALERLGKTGTGPGTEQVNQIKSFLQSVGVPGIDVKKVKDYDEAHKYLTDWVTANGDSSTNDKLAAAFSSNASTKISNAAAVDVAKAALSLRKMKQAQLEEFQASGLPDDKYGKWASEWNRKQDPRVFGWDYMNDDQRKNMLRSASGVKRDQMIMQIHQAAENGLINPASLVPAGR